MQIEPEKLREELLNKIGKIGTFIVRESSNSRTTNVKTLTGWELVSVGKIFITGCGAKVFQIELKSKKGAKRYFDRVISIRI